MTESISFDRAAGYYDDTRSLPDAEMEVLVSRLVAEIPRDGPCLEIGIGTGRIALPLMQRGGVDVVGVDLSPEMLHRFRAKRRDAKVAIADATRLPFARGTFASAVASHVLHLIPGWVQAVDELIRVVLPGGVLLASKGAEETRTDWQGKIRRRFFDEAGDPPWPPGIASMDQLDEVMRARRAGVRRVEDVRVERMHSISEQIAALEKGIYAACWSLDDETRRRAAGATRNWASREFGDLDLMRPTQRSSDWRAYRLPA